MKYILITCATSHLGQGVAAHLAKSKYPLILLGKNAQKLENIKQSIATSGFDQIITKIIDFSIEESLISFGKWLQTQAIELQGTLVITPRPHIKDKLFPASSEWHHLVQTCFIGPLEILKSSLSHYSAHGKILIISGISSLQVLPEHAAFGTLRSMWLAHAKALSYQLGAKGIHVNTISPGGILTDYMVDLIQQKAKHNNRTFDEQYAESISNVPLRKYASVEEIAHIIEFFLSTKSNHVTGINMACDGGFTKNY